MRRQRPHNNEGARDGTSDVTNVLLHSKKLLAALTQWSKHEATEVDVSDAFVSFGNEFNSICRVYMSMGIETNDLGDVPQMLREVLEVILAEEASTQNMDLYYPRVTNIILPLIKQLKHKAAIARLSIRNSGSWGSSGESLGSQVTKTANQPQRSNATVSHNRVRPKQKAPVSQAAAPQVAASQAVTSQAVELEPLPMEAAGSMADQRRVTDPQQRPRTERTDAPAEVVRYVSDTAIKDPLTRLQQSDGPARRASRRFSAYHMSKVMASDSVMLPTTASHSAVPAEYHASTVLDESWRIERQVSPSQNYNMNGRLAPVPEQASSIRSSPDLVRQPSRRSQSDATPEMKHTPIMQSQVLGMRIFLRMGNRILKTEIQSPPSLAAIRLQFVDSFAYVPPSGQLFPELAVQDPTTGIEYELNEHSLRDVTDGTLVVLKAKGEEEISLEKRMLSIEQMVKELLTKQATQATQAPPAKSWQKPTAGQPGPTAGPTAGANTGAGFSAQATRAEIASIRQAASKGFAAAQKEIAELSGQILALREGGMAGGGTRGFMDEHIKKLETNSEELVNLIDDLQDLVDGQRKDVASRGVRMSAKELEATRKDLDRAQAQLDEFASYISREKPAWKHTWGEELEKIVNEQEQLRLQEKLVGDMAEDLRSAHETFLLVEECSLELAKSESVKRGPAIAAPDVGDVSGSIAREALLGEVQALRPNHEQRLEAIERAERVRKRELAMRTEEFEQELDGFVADNKLRPSGGIEALELKREQVERETRAAALKSEAEAQQRRREENERKREAHKKRLESK